jgi:hypothetical protein
MKKELFSEIYASGNDATKRLLEKEYPELLTPKDGWYVDSKYTLWIGYLECGKLMYGINAHGCWFGPDQRYYSLQPNDIIATDQEALKRLAEHAKRLGYKEGVIIQTFHHHKWNVTLDDTDPVVRHDGFWFGGCMIMKDGKWAPIVSTPNKYKLMVDDALAVESNDFQDIIDHVRPTKFNIGDWVIFQEGMPPEKIIKDNYGTGFKTQRVNGSNTNWYKRHAERKATNEEVKEAFINEAKKRNLWDNPNVYCFRAEGRNAARGLTPGYLITFDELWSKHGLIYEKGTWTRTL